MNVNGKNISIFDLDTRDAIKNRIAVALKTLPKYIYNFPPDNKPLPKILVVRDLLSEMLEDENFNNFYEKNKKIIQELKLDPKKDLLQIWLTKNSNVNFYNNEIFIEEFLKSLPFSYDNEDFLYFIEKEWNNIQPTLETNIENIVFSNRKYEKIYELLEDEKFNQNDIIYTPFRVESTTLLLTLNIVDMTILELFNQIILNNEIPVCVCKNYYKISKTYIPKENWSLPETEDIIMKVCKKKNFNPDSPEDLVDVKIFIEDKSVQSIMIVKMEKGNISRDEFISRFCDSFSDMKVQYEKLKETEIIGNFYMPLSTINNYVFSDLIMNNDTFSSLLTVNESEKATKKENDGGPWLYAYFDHPTTGLVTVNISQRYVDRTDAEIKREIELESKEGSIYLENNGEPYIRLRITAKDIEAINFFMKIFLKLYKLYEEEAGEVIEFYKRYIPDFDSGKVLEIKAPKQKDIVSEVFPSQYTRYCAGEKGVTLIKKEDDIDEIKKEHAVYIFPRDKPETGETFVSDGVKQNYYYCKNPEYPFFGLQKNHLENKEKYPYLPCCFKTDQTNKSVFKHYYKGEKIMEEKEKKQQDFILTDKILNNNIYGTLPKELQKLFSYIDIDSESKYIRCGVFRNKQSFLNVVMTALSHKTNMLSKKSEKDKKLFLTETLAKLAKFPILAKQCCYNTQISQIAQNINDENLYFDPRKYIQMLEEYFDCTIFLFNKQGMFLPNYLQSYYRREHDSDYIFVYENWGSESDNLDYPQCEIIVKWKENKQVLTSFSKNGTTKSLEKIFSLISESYCLSKKITNVEFPMDEKYIVSQNTDAYGKVRCVNIKFRDREVSILTDPIFPFKTKNKKDIYPVEIEFAIEVFKFLGTDVLSQNRNEKEILQLNSKFGNVNISIPIKENENLNLDVPTVSTVIKYPGNRQSHMDIFNMNKKLSRYIIEYVLWVFSSYINDKKIIELTDKVLANFAKETFLIEEKHVYENVLKTFGKNNSICKDGKIIVTSEEMIKRLMYLLKIYSIRDIKNLSTYYQRKVITNYYVDVTDFDSHSNQIILFGEDSIKKWIENNSFKIKLYDKIMKNLISPYFLKLKNLDNKVYLAQNVTSIERAKNISLFWQKYGYNILDPEEEKTNFAYTLFSYDKDGNIIKNKVKGDIPPSGIEIKIIGYYSGKTMYFTVLLDI